MSQEICHLLLITRTFGGKVRTTNSNDESYPRDTIFLFRFLLCLIKVFKKSYGPVCLSDSNRKQHQTIKTRKRVTIMRKLNKVLALLLVLVFVVVGCGKEDVTETVYESKDTVEVVEEVVEEVAEEVKEVVEEVQDDMMTVYPYTFTDKFGNDITIETKPETIVSFAPEITETIFALGKGDTLVGRSSYCDYPSEALEVTDLGSLFEFSLESVIEVNPDIVFLSSMVSEEVYQQLVDNKIQVATFDYDDNLNGTMTQINTIGDIIDSKMEAAEISGAIQAGIDDLTAKAAGRQATSVYFAVSVGEYTSAATGDTFINDIIVTTGATNAAADGTFWMYTVEQLVEQDPDFVICSNKYETKGNIESLDGYKDLTAVKEGRLFEVDENIFFRQGPRVVEALYILDDIIFNNYEVLNPYSRQVVLLLVLVYVFNSYRFIEVYELSLSDQWFNKFVRLY